VRFFYFILFANMLTVYLPAYMMTVQKVNFQELLEISYQWVCDSKQASKRYFFTSRPVYTLSLVAF